MSFLVHELGEFMSLWGHELVSLEFMRGGGCEF